MQIELENSKYTYILDEDTGEQEVLRYGEPWRKDDLIGDNLVLAMAHRIAELEDSVYSLKESMALFHLVSSAEDDIKNGNVMTSEQFHAKLQTYKGVM